MYVCICHGFTDSQVRDLTAGGCRSFAEAYRRLSGGEPPQCGKCVPFLREMLKASTAPIACAGEAVGRAQPAYATAAE